MSTMRIAGSRRLLPALLLILSALSVGVVHAQDSSQLPEPRGYVNDFVGVVEPSYEEAMRRLAESVERATGAQMAVAVVESIEPYGSIEQYSIALVEKWAVGSGEENNGVLLLVAVQERLVRIEVGYGLEGAITDGTAGAIRDEALIPALRENRYGEGLLRGLQALSAEIAEEYQVDLSEYGADEQPERISSSRGSSGGGLGRVIYLLIFMVFFGGGRFLWPLLFLTGGRGFYGGGFGAGRSSGGFSGGSSGFGGFGGGGFGGGGASGSF